MEHMSDFHDTAMSGDYSKQERDVAESGPTFLACYVELWVAGYDGYGMLKIMSGPRSIPKCKNDGSTSMRARRHGTIHGCMLKDGARRCHTVLPSPWMVQPTSLEDMFGRRSTPRRETDVPKKSCFISRMRSEAFDDRTWQKMSDSVWRKRTLEKIGNFVVMSLLQLLNRLCPT